MNAPAPDLFARYRSERGRSILIGQVIVVAMMTALAAGFALAGARIDAAWKGGYLIVVALIVALEAIYTRDHLNELDTRERVIFHTTEWIAFAVVLKLLLYLLNDPAQLLVDIPRWQKDFLGAFITTEFALGIGVAALVWFCARAYAGELDDLNEREEDSGWDELGKLQNALHVIRGRIVSRTFALGGLLVVLAIISRLEIGLLKNVPENPFAFHAPVLVVLVYFGLALVLFSQTQFSLLRTRWRWQRLPISERLAKNWLRYALLFFLALALIVFFLPTRYSMGLLDTLRIVIQFLIQLVSFLVFLITLPVAFCLSLFRLTSAAPINTQPPSTIQIIPGGAPAEPVAWLEFLKSLLFWMIFLGVIVFALRYFFSQNEALLNAVSKFPITRWLAGLFRELIAWLRGANRQVNQLVRDGIKRLRRPRTPSPVKTFKRILSLSRMNPREKIIYFYLNLIQLGGERGLSRRPAETPYQYDRRLSSAVPEVNEDLHTLTDEFIEARYSPHPVDLPAAEQASSLWDRIKAVLRGWKRTE